ncbi:DEAD-domain-containing protein [Westerdykella ornata]|uniref:ATP-dependent RNA helicase n=1 Tax=Westerdykella ornata TaxID=318751 RepID=A0A6A6JHA9_WESOR|nr:DEAD-domain-containing protein [Westerdykella ornata]KAF2275493.1 DEAD-domain-containing protein [Westerdykella ornata]
MVQTSAKRSRPHKNGEMKSRKRQKVEGQSRKVRLDQLQWKPVEMPDRLDDYEGFFGLEEIDDVDVVRDEVTGAVTFESRKAEEKLKKAEEGNSNKVEEEREDEEGDAESWEGFSEDEGQTEAQEENAQHAAEEPATVEQPGQTAKESKKKDKKRKRDDTNGESNHETKKTQTNKPQQKDDLSDVPELNGKSVFDILADAPTDDEDVEVDVSAWEPLGLSPDTLEAIARLKFAQPTTIQSSAIPEILAGHDVIGKASTGSGKTLAFGIPVLETYLGLTQGSPERKLPLALIVSPTRELAHQISAHLSKLCSGVDEAPSIATITGGLSVQKQQRQLETANIIVGTPGRLWEVISSGHGLLASLKKIRFLIVDEADRLLSEGHFKEMKEIINVLDREDSEGPNEDEPENARDTEDSKVERQTLVFSATFHKGLQQKLAGKNKKAGELMNKQESMEYLLRKLHFREEKPKFIDANPTSQLASGLKEGLIECVGTEKDLYLYSILMFHPNRRSLIFTNSISAVRRLTPFLQNLNLPALPLHSQMPQKARLRSVERFAERAGSILVATDVAARGLDIPGVEIVIHYHLPRTADTYVHRSGRTARGSASGSSVLICAPEEVAGVRRLVAKVHAQASSSGKKAKTTHFIRTLDIDRRIVSRLKPRASLAKTLADAVIAKEKKHSEDDFLRQAAEDLGVEYDSDELEAGMRGKRGRGSGRKKKEKEARSLSKAELQAMRAELKALLAQRVNTGVSARYLTSGGVDVQSLLSGVGNTAFLGEVGGLGLDDEEEGGSGEGK